MFELYDHQKKMEIPMRVCRNALLLSPCGSGKTLATVYNWLEQRPTPHLIYVLPTKTLLKSIEKDIVGIITDLDLSYHLVSLERKEFGNADYISIATDYGEKRETRLYAHDIVLTTLDSYISRLYRSFLTPERYRDLPIARILNSTTVFDEAHMYDTYTHTLMRYTLEFLREANAHHIVVSATLGEKLLNFLGVDHYESIRVPEEKWMSFCGKKTIIGLEGYNGKNDIGDKITNIIEENNIEKALIILNTIEKAQNVYIQLKNMYDDIILLHSRFKPDDRNKSEEKTLEKAKNISDSKRIFVIATQVVEAGLDVSFPNLITDVPAGDSLVQRIGRCARRKGEHGNIFIVYPLSESPLPYTTEDIESVKRLMKTFPITYNTTFEKRLIETVIPPELKGLSESKARGMILSAFNSISAFGKGVVNIPTRDATPVYLYFGTNIKTDEKLMKNSVRIDVRFLYGISQGLKNFTFYQRRYNKNDDIKIKERKRPHAWYFAVPKKSLRYDTALGVVKSE
jgi:CRISPR-associated endonuclease/helicase Cas3